jgi:hypothetical protein
LGPDLQWHDQTDASVYRWPHCDRCHHTQPFDNDADTRLAARRRELTCPNCRAGRLRF